MNGTAVSRERSTRVRQETAREVAQKIKHLGSEFALQIRRFGKRQDMTGRRLRKFSRRKACRGIRRIMTG
ncbi:MAG: hypothetical protein ACLRZN_08745 [Dialister invisus]